jgi:hypothetical protein
MAKHKPLVKMVRPSFAIPEEIWAAIQDIAKTEQRTGAGKLAMYVLEGYARDTNQSE